MQLKFCSSGAILITKIGFKLLNFEILLRQGQLLYHLLEFPLE